MKRERLINNLKFIVDNNAGKLAKWLRIMGYDTLFFNGTNDAHLIATALAEGRVILTRDTQIGLIGKLTLSVKIFTKFSAKANLKILSLPQNILRTG